jgi:hypothetical protein
MEIKQGQFIDQAAWIALRTGNDDEDDDNENDNK